MFQNFLDNGLQNRFSESDVLLRGGRLETLFQLMFFSNSSRKLLTPWKYSRFFIRL